MLFNGKYYNKPGHLGMTRAELKEALQGGGGPVPAYEAAFVETTETYVLYEAIIGDAGTTTDFNLFVADFISKNPRISISLTGGLITFDNIIYYLTASQYATIVNPGTPTTGIISTASFNYDDINGKVELQVVFFISL